MSESSMIRRVEDAIARAMGRDPGAYYGYYTNAARAAIEAMREPTNAMVKAHKGASYRANGQSASKTEAIREGHRAAIDAALSEKS